MRRIEFYLWNHNVTTTQDTGKISTRTWVIEFAVPPRYAMGSSPVCSERSVIAPDRLDAANNPE